MKINNKAVKLLILSIIFAIAAILRLWNLASIPPHLTPDEASIGYNAYSILKTGRDEYGTLFPIIFKSFGDHKPGLYIYATVPSVAVFGLTEFAVRFPSVLAGLSAIYLLYLVVNELFANKKLGTISAIILAFSPWHIYFSRGAWEANLALTLTLAGIYFFLKSLKQEKHLIFSAIFFALTLVTYQGAKISSLIVLVILFLLHLKELAKLNRSIFFTSLAIGLVISSSAIMAFFQEKTGRLEVFNIFFYPRSKEYLETFLKEGNEKVGTLTYYLYHSEPLNFIRGILGRWFNHFSGRFLFFEGDYSNLRHSSPYQGVMLYTDVIFLILGLASVFREKISKPVAFVLLWLVFSPLPSALSRDQVHAIRSLNMVVPLVILVSLGVYKVVNSKKLYSKLLLPIGVISFIYFAESYFMQLPHLRSQYWYYGHKQVVRKIAQNQSTYNQIIFQQSFDQPYIFFLFFQKYDPRRYQKNSRLIQNSADVGVVEKLDNIHFTEINWSNDKEKSNTLIIGPPTKIPQDVDAEEVKYLNGIITAFRIYSTK